MCSLGKTILLLEPLELRGILAQHISKLQKHNGSFKKSHDEGSGTFVNEAKVSMKVTELMAMFSKPDKAL